MTPVPWPLFGRTAPAPPRPMPPPQRPGTWRTHWEHDTAWVPREAHVLDLPDHGRRAIEQARDELYSDEQAAQGLPLLARTAGVHDEHKVTVRAAWLVAEGRA